MKGTATSDICPECGEKMIVTSIPYQRFLFTIPFTRTEIIAVTWKDGFFCGSCADAEASTREGRIFDAGFDEGYQRGLTEAN